MRLEILVILLVTGVSMASAYPYIYESFSVGENIYCMDMAEDASAIAVGTVSGKFYLLNDELRIIEVKSFDSGIVKVSISGEYYALATINGKIEVYKENKLYSIDLEKAVNCLDISYNGEVLACHGDNLTFFVNGKEYWSKEISPRDAVLSLDGEYIAVATGDGNISIYKKDGSLLWKKEIEGAKMVAISEEGDYIALCTNDDLYLFDKKGNLLYKKELKNIKDVEITQNGNYILCALPKSLVYFDRFSHELWEYEAMGIEDVAISGKGDIISIAYWNGNIELYNNSKELKPKEEVKKEPELNLTKEKQEREEEKGFTNVVFIVIAAIILILITLNKVKKKR